MNATNSSRTNDFMNTEKNYADSEPEGRILTKEQIFWQNRTSSLVREMSRVLQPIFQQVQILVLNLAQPLSHLTWRREAWASHPTWWQEIGEPQSGNSDPHTSQLQKQTIKFRSTLKTDKPAYRRKKKPIDMTTILDAIKTVPTRIEANTSSGNIFHTQVDRFRGIKDQSNELEQLLKNQLRPFNNRVTEEANIPILPETVARRCHEKFTKTIETTLTNALIKCIKNHESRFKWSGQIQMWPAQLRHDNTRFMTPWKDWRL